MNQQSTLGRSCIEDISIPLFNNVTYTLDDSLSDAIKAGIKEELDVNGASESATGNIYFTNNNEPSGFQDKTAVKLDWIEAAIRNQFVHDIRYYSPSEDQYMAGVVLAIVDLPADHIKHIFKEITKYGAQSRDTITSDVTHVVCLKPSDKMYQESLLDFKHVVLPHWLDDCFRLKQRVDEEGYRFPNPVFSETATIHEYPSIDSLDRITIPNKKVLQDQVVYLGSDIDIATPGFVTKLAACIEKAGGKLIDRYDDSVSIVVCKYRSSHDCIMALEDQNIVVSFWWLTNTLARGHIETPLSRLLDYPIPKGGIPGMDDLRVSITGYTEINRDYLRRLLLYTGAVFDPLMDKDCTHLICAGNDGSKVQRARKRGMTIINQLWLEESFQQWQMMPTDDARYQYLPTNNTLNLISATTPLIQSQVRLWMNKETTPHCTKEKKIYKPLKPTASNIMKPRAAAVKANRVLHNTLMPDANVYKKENTKRSENGGRITYRKRAPPY